MEAAIFVGKWRHNHLNKYAKINKSYAKQDFVAICV